MQPIRRLEHWLRSHQQDLFTLQDFRALFPDLTDNAFKLVLSRAVKQKILLRPCRGIYFFPDKARKDGHLLYRIATHLRPNHLLYLSLESALSDAGVISQIPISHITVMTKGRRQNITCDLIGTIEFVHTKRDIHTLSDELIYDERIGMWRASVQLALQDMKFARRNLDLINWDVANELV